jgi:hypothetical protein
MKLPFSLSVKLVFRLVLPGLIVAFAELPILRRLLACFYVQAGIEAPLTVSALVSGWLLTVFDMHLYMFYEGRRYWPRFLYRWLLASEERRLSRLTERHRKARELSKDNPGNTDARRKYREASVEMRTFPMNEQGDYCADSPTRLGNLLSAVESRPKQAYGLESTFYWYRLWLLLDKDTRESVDEQQALVDSALYVSFALNVAGLFSALYSALAWRSCYWRVQLPDWRLLAATALACWLAGYVLYRSSLQLHAQFGETFKALFDVNHDKLRLEAAVREIEEVTKSNLRHAPVREQHMAVWRYLHNFRVKKDDRVVAPPAYRDK